MHHSFDVSVAEKYGVNVAIFLNNLSFWIKKNQANNKHFHEGRYWTYNSSEALTILFPYWSTDQMDRLIKKCVSHGLLFTGNYNETTYDRTRWYAFTDKALLLLNFIPRNNGMEAAESNIPSREIAEPIPDINTYINTDKREGTMRKKRASLSVFKPNDKSKALAKELGLPLDEELLSFQERHSGRKTQYEFQRWLKSGKEYQDRKKVGSRKEEAPSSVVNRMGFYVSEKNIIRP